MEISKETIDYVLAFSRDRDWEQFHNPKDLALSLSLEASELLELFQWLDSDEAVKRNRDKMREELADVIVYALDFANALGFEDLNSLIMDKMKKNEAKYPLEKAKGSNRNIRNSNFFLYQAAFSLGPGLRRIHLCCLCPQHGGME